MPERMTEGAAGWDLRACLEAPITLAPGDRRLIPTGLALAIPNGLEGAIRPRSGLALRHGIGVLNSPGTIDADYRGEIKVLLVNLSEEEFLIEDGERIAQMVVAKHETVNWLEAAELSETERGAGGYGSTGKN